MKKCLEIIKNISLKTTAFIILLLLGILLGAIYGIIHDQLTYTISNEYYTKFKFQQFGVINLPDRMAVTIVGIMATWWIGLIIGFILGCFGFIQKDCRKMLRYSLESFMISMIIAFAIGLTGLLYGFLNLADKPSSYFEYWYFPENLQNFRSYIAVGLMHNFSYIGGMVGMIFGIAWQFIRRFRKKN